MEKYIFIGLLFISTKLIGQPTVEGILKSINTIEQAELYVEKNPKVDCELVELDSDRDNSSQDSVLLSKKRGEIYSINKYIYKTIFDTTTSFFRASYIYLDGSKLSGKKIDNIRQSIISKYKSGVSFKDLYREYNMDGNPNFGDTGYFGENMMVKEFETAVKEHNAGEIFTVDTPSMNWYHVVLKTHKDKITKKATILKIKSGS